MKKLLLVVLFFVLPQQTFPISFGSVFGEKKQTVERKESFEELGKQFEETDKKLEKLFGKNDESLKSLKILFPHRMRIRLLSSLMFSLLLIRGQTLSGQTLSGSIIGGLSSALGSEVVGKFYDEISGARKESDQFWVTSKKIDELLKEQEVLLTKREAFLKVRAH